MIRTLPILSAAVALAPPAAADDRGLLEIRGDAWQAPALAGTDFFRAIRFDEIMVEGLDTVEFVEFVEAGETEIGFVATGPDAAAGDHR
jgi:hypothetical protein